MVLLINLVWLKFSKIIFVYFDKAFCVSCLLLTAVVNAQQSDYAVEDNEEYDDYEEYEEYMKFMEEVYIEAFPLESEEEYNIYRKDNPDDPCDRGLDSYDYEKSWYDDSQIYINSRFCEPALWFDNFFATDRLFAEGPAGTYVRWRNDFTYDEEDYFKFKTNLTFSIELPGLKDHLRLTFEGDEDEELRDIAPGNAEDTRNSLGLQLDVVENVRSKFNVNVSMAPRVRFRYRYTYPVYEDIILRLTQEVQREKTVNSARTLLEVERAFKQKFLFRSSTEAIVSEDFEGVDWLQAFVLYQRLNKKESLSYESSVNGINEPRTLATNYRVGIRFRRNFHREWLFYEIVPEVTWPITLDEQRMSVVKDRRSKWQILLRLEVHFGNAYRKRYQDYN